MNRLPPTAKRRDGSTRYRQPRTLTQAEGAWINAVKAFCVPFRFPRFPSPEGPLPEPHVVEAGIWHIATACLRFLLYECNGHEAVPLTRSTDNGADASGRVRLRGSLFDADVNAGFSLRYSYATRDAWLGLARGLSALSSESKGIRFAKKVARESIIVDETIPGDWLFYWILTSGLQKAPLYADDVAVLRRRLYAGSPLASLADLQPSTIAARQRLLSPDSVRLIELFGPMLATTWREQFDWLWLYRGSPRPFIDRATQIAAAMEQWFSILQSHQRPELGIQIGQWLLNTNSLIREAGGDVREVLTSKIELRTIKDRDAALVPFVRLFSIGRQLVEQRQEFAQTRYGEPGYDEAQVFLARFETDIGERDQDLVRLAVDVRGSVG